MDKDTLLGLASDKVDEKHAPVRDAAARLRAALGAWEAIEKDAAEREVTQAIAKALGAVETEDLSLDAALRSARAELAEAMRAMPLGVEVAAWSAPAPEAAGVTQREQLSNGLARVVVSEPGPAFVLRRDPTDEERARAEALLREIDDLDREVKTAPMHACRLEPLLQALVAEVRLVSGPWSPSEDLHDRLTKRLGVLNTIRKNAGLTKFIQGLAFGASGDWAKIARACRRKVEAFDRDAETGPTSSRKNEQKPMPEAFLPFTCTRCNKRVESAAEDCWLGEEVPGAGTEPHVRPPLDAEALKRNGRVHLDAELSAAKEAMLEAIPSAEFPRLRVLNLPVVVGGGRAFPQGQLEELGRKLGLRLEHCAIDHANPRAEQALVARVRSGKVGAVIVVEGYMRHATFASVVRTCDARSVPYAYAGKGKMEGIEAACVELERKLGEVGGKRRKA